MRCGILLILGFEIEAAEHRSRLVDCFERVSIRLQDITSGSHVNMARATAQRKRCILHGKCRDGYSRPRRSAGKVPRHVVFVKALLNKNDRAMALIGQPCVERGVVVVVGRCTLCLGKNLLRFVGIVDDDEIGTLARDTGADRSRETIAVERRFLLVGAIAVASQLEAGEYLAKPFCRNQTPEIGGMFASQLRGCRDDGEPPWPAGSLPLARRVDRANGRWSEAAQCQVRSRPLEDGPTASRIRAPTWPSPATVWFCWKTRRSHLLA